MNAVLNPPKVPEVGRLTWKLRETLSRRKISNKALAAKLGQKPEVISRLKSRDTLPAIGDDRVQVIRLAITELSAEEYGPCKTSELVGIEDDED